MSTFDPNQYPPALATLLRQAPLQPLGPGQPHQAMRAALSALSDASFQPHQVINRAQAAACRAGLWLRYDFLDESHAISQELDTVEGSYWHAMMHRREPDHSNAAYWLRRVGQHPIFVDLARAAAELGYASQGSGWDAFSFNDACAVSLGKGDSTEELLRQVQEAEWRLLFAYCFQLATSPADGS